MSKPLACLRGRLIAREGTVGCSLGHYKPIPNVSSPSHFDQLRLAKVMTHSRVLGLHCYTPVPTEELQMLTQADTWVG